MTRKALAAAFVLLLLSPSALPGDEKPKTEDKAKAAVAEAKVRPTPRSKKEGLRFLERVTVTVAFDGTPLTDAVAYLATVADANIIIGPALRAEGGVEARKVTLRLKKVTARQALEFIADGQDLGIGFVSGVLTVTTRKEARGKPVLRLHPLGELLMPLTDFPAPDLILRPAGAEKKVEEEVQRKPAFADADAIIELLKKTAGEGTWEDPEVSVSTMGEYLVVKQYEEVQDEIGKLLALLRASR